MNQMRLEKLVKIIRGDTKISVTTNATDKIHR